jgi:hypothetical protein
MENDSTFVCPEGVYSVTEEHKQPVIQNHLVNNNPISYPTRLTAVSVRFQPTKQAPAFAQLLGAGKQDKDKRDDVVSQTSSDSPDDPDTQPIPTPDTEQPTLFSPGAKKKHASRPKHNIRTTSSTFIARIQTAEGMAKALQAKQGDVTYMFYNFSKTFSWIEAGAKSKVRS